MAMGTVAILPKVPPVSWKGPTVIATTASVKRVMFIAEDTVMEVMVSLTLWFSNIANEIFTYLLCQLIWADLWYLIYIIAQLCWRWYEVSWACTVQRFLTICNIHKNNNKQLFSRKISCLLVLCKICFLSQNTVLLIQISLRCALLIGVEIQIKRHFIW